MILMSALLVSDGCSSPDTVLHSRDLRALTYARVPTLWKWVFGERRDVRRREWTWRGCDSEMGMVRCGNDTQTG